MADSDVILPVEKLYGFLFHFFKALGYSRENAETAGNVLLKADLKGIDSHGVARLKGYLNQIDKGIIQVNGKPETVHETPSTATLDANKSLGLISAQEGMKMAIDKGKNVGSGWVAIKNSTHFGIASAHTDLAIEEDMIGLAMTNASPLVAPAGSTDAMLGTNPVCFAIPAGTESPLIADLATTVVSNGKLEIAGRNNQNIPKGWAQDKKGNNSEDPDVLKKGGTLLPLGSDYHRSRHKGYALSAVVDIMSGVLPGANFGPWVPPFVPFLDQSKEKVGEGIGHFLGAWRVDAFQPCEDFKQAVDRWIRTMRKATPDNKEQNVKIPGDPERETREKREKEGIPLNNQVYEDLLAIQERMGLAYL